MAVTIQIQVGDPSLGHWPVFGGLPYLLAQGVVFYRGSLVDAVVHFLEVMLKPAEIQPVQIKAQRLAAEGYPVHVVLTVAAVLPGSQNDLAHAPREVMDQFQGFGGTHAVVVKPAGLNQRRDLRPDGAFLPVGHTPEIVVVTGFQPPCDEGHIVPQSLFRQVGQGADVQHFLPVIAFHQLRVEGFLRHRKGPGQHARGERPTPAGQIHKGAARADYADQSFQVGVAAGSGCPLYITQVGPAHHTDASAAPWLSGDPVQSIVAVLHLVVVGQPFAFTGVSAAHILYYHRVAALDVTVVYLTAVLFAVGGAYQHCGHRGTAVFRQVYVGGKMYPVPHGHREGLRMFYREQLFLRPGRAPQAQDGLLLGTGFHQHRDHLPGRAGDGDQPPVLHLFVVGEFYIPLQVAAAVFAGVALAAQGNFPGAMQPRLVLGKVLPQGGKVHLHKETVKIPVLFSQVLPVQQRAGMHVQFPDLGCAVAQPQSAVQDA